MRIGWESEDWDCHFGGLRQIILSRPTSDHFPVLLEGGRCFKRGPYPFRSENVWIKEEGFKELITDWWNNFEFRGTSSFVLTEKIKALKVKLKAWNQEVFGRVEENKKSALKKVVTWDDIESQRPLSASELGERLLAIEDFKKWLIMEETSWRQKSREIWVKEEDRNTWFFHRMANAHKIRNTIERIRIRGEWLTGGREC